VPRVPRYECRDFASLAQVLRRCDAVTVIVDVEPGVVSWGADGATFTDGIAVLRQVLAQTDVREVVLATNSRAERPPVAEGVPSVTLVRRAAKPWRVGYARAHARPLLVVGDQVLTDGLLAWRLGAPFVHWQVDGPMPGWPRIQRAVGSRLLRFLFL
jgi:predicted HAD superfamily phosphohydrolase YqeG